MTPVRRSSTPSTPSAPLPLWLDRRKGSGELYTLLQARHLPVELTLLEFGDLAFCGHSPLGPSSVLIGIERKRIRDLLQSFTSGRLSGHQLPGLTETYAHRWLVVEGAYRESADGFLELPRRPGQPWEKVRMLYRAVEAYLLTLTLRGGLHVQRTFSPEETCGWVAQLWAWWTTKAYSEHRSHLALHDAPDHHVFFRPGLVQRVAAQLPGIDQKAVAVAAAFPTVLDMAVASEDVWQTIPGIGKVGAGRLVTALQRPKQP